MGAEAISAHWLLEQLRFLAGLLVALWEIMQRFMNRKKWSKRKKENEQASSTRLLRRRKFSLSIVCFVRSMMSSASFKPMTGIKLNPG